MAMLLTTKEAFEKVKKYLEDNQYPYTVETDNGGYLVRIE